MPVAHGLNRHLTQAWRQRGLMAWLLWPVSQVYGLASGIRNLMFAVGLLKTHHLKVPVIVVGNVVAGGAGKTPVVMALVMHLQARGWHVGVVSRGYGRSTRDCREVQDSCLATEVGDEPALIKWTCHVPVFVAIRRVDAAQALLDRYPETQIIVSDDGLQHHALHRDLEICVFDDRGIGNGFLLPAGPLREAWPRPTDLVLHTGATPAFADGFRAKRSLAGYALRADSRSVPIAELRGKPILAVAAIAQPETFFAMLRQHGLTLAHTVALPDHFTFDGWVAPVANLSPASDTPILICTEKDAVKLWRTHPTALAVPLVLVPEQGFFSAIDQAVTGWHEKDEKPPPTPQKHRILNEKAF